MVPRQAKTGAKQTKTGLRQAKGGPKTAHDQPKTCPRQAKTGPRQVQYRPRQAKTGPRQAKKRPKSRFGTIFGTAECLKTIGFIVVSPYEGDFIAKAAKKRKMSQHNANMAPTWPVLASIFKGADSP